MLPHVPHHCQPALARLGSMDTLGVLESTVGAKLGSLTSLGLGVGLRYGLGVWVV